MLFTVVVPVFAVDHISTEDLEFEEFANDASYMVAPEPWHPFVLVPQNEYLLENAWGTYEEVDGFLYVKNMNTMEIIQISDKPMQPALFDTKEYMYCITEDNQLIQADYTGEYWRVLYEAQYGDLAAVWYRTGKLYFIDGEHVCIYELARNIAVPLKIVPGVVSVYPCPDGTLLLRNQYNEDIAYDYRANSLRVVTDECEVDALISGYNIVDTTEIEENTYEITAGLMGTDITFPLSDYPNGSFFTKPSGHTTKCNHETMGYALCDSYRDRGFAYLAHDRFAHISSSVPLSAFSEDKVEYEYTEFLSNSDVKAYFNSLTTGAYVRLSKHNRAQDTDDKGTHSLVYVSVSGGYVQTYDANRNVECRVAYEARTHETIRTQYPYRIEHISHSYNATPISYSMAYHKINCANCVGFILQEHNFVSYQGTMRCSDCGRNYTGPITP